MGVTRPGDSALAFVDLNRLARTDPQAAEVGRQLNSARGVNLDGRFDQLRRDEFVLAGGAEWQLNPALRPVLLRLDQAFSLGNVGRPDTGPTPLVSANDVTALVRGGLSMPGPMFVSSSGRQTSFIADEKGRVLRSEAKGSGAFTPGVPQDFVAYGVAGTRIKGRDYLYSVEPDGAGAAKLVRRQVFANGLGKPLDIKVEPKLPYLHWPQLTTLAGGQVVFAAVTPREQPFVAVSPDGGKSFRLQPIGLSPKDDMTLAHVGGFRDGALAVTNQVADASGKVTSYVRTSTDGVSFSRPLRITDTNPNVHDAFVVPRKDGDVDLYYLKSTETGFEAWRRAYTRAGALGPEQRLTGADLGSVEKPQAHRLPDGSLRLSFAKRNTPDDFDVVTTLLKDDAPRPR